MSDMILHHYPTSPFSEKVRVAFGIKGLTWKSVIIPSFLPEPNIMPLTGGYRKTPVLQIGADIYCDTQLILREIERRAPEPTLYPSQTCGLAEAWELTGRAKPVQHRRRRVVCQDWLDLAASLHRRSQQICGPRLQSTGHEGGRTEDDGRLPRPAPLARDKLLRRQALPLRPTTFGRRLQPLSYGVVRKKRPSGSPRRVSRHPGLGRPTGIHRSWRAHHDRRAGSARNRQGRRTRNPSIDRYSIPTGDGWARRSALHPTIPEETRSRANWLHCRSMKLRSADTTRSSET